MAHAYTPGLKAAELSVVEKQRKLPLLGDVLVKENDMVTAKQLVARTELPGKIYPKNVRGELGLNTPDEMLECMLKKEGDSITRGEVLARTKGFFGFFKTEYKAPITGSIGDISRLTGQVIFKEPPIPVEINAFVEGKVTHIFPEEGVKVETRGVHIQGIIGLGGETYGEIMMAVETPDQLLDENNITEKMKGKIIVGGSRITPKGLQQAIKMGIIGVIAGGFDYQDIKDILGKDLGVAITGHEKIGLTLILTEGFGTIPMAGRTFHLLKKYAGRFASINGATQIRAGVMRPEIIITHNDDVPASTKDYTTSGMEPGDQIRVIRAPYFGKLGIVKSLPVEQTQVESGAWVRVLTAEIDGEEVLLPRANIEMIEK